VQRAQSFNLIPSAPASDAATIARPASTAVSNSASPLCCMRPGLCRAWTTLHLLTTRRTPSCVYHVSPGLSYTHCRPTIPVLLAHPGPSFPPSSAKVGLLQIDARLRRSRPSFLPRLYNTARILSHMHLISAVHAGGIADKGFIVPLHFSVATPLSSGKHLQAAPIVSYMIHTPFVDCPSAAPR
jgi:hypothetical protein